MFSLIETNYTNNMYIFSFLPLILLKTFFSFLSLPFILGNNREREHQLAEYENEPHSRRYHTENDMGKNYLLETYLNGLQDVERKTDSNRSNSNSSTNDNKNDGGENDDVDKEITTPGNSDSGVNTEDIATSPDIGTTSPLTHDSSSNSIDNNNDGTKKNTTLMDTTTALTNICKRLSIREKPPKKPMTRKTNETKTSTISREAKLIMEHANRMEFCEKMKKRNVATGAAVANNPSADKNDTNGIGSRLQSKALNVNDHLAGQIELLEKVIAINKHIQHEEELMVRLNAKIHKYEFDNPNLTETEMKMALEQINTNIESSTNELAKTEHEINESNEMLMNKAKLFKELSNELETLEMTDTKTKLIQVPSHQIQIHTTNSTTNEAHDMRHSQPAAQVTQRPIQTAAQTSNQPIHTDLKTVIQSNQLPNANPGSQINVPLTNQSISKQITLPLTSNLKTGTLPNLISSALKKATQISAKNTYCGTIPKRLPQCNQISASKINRSAVQMAAPSSNGILQCSGNGTIITGTATTTSSTNNNNNSQTFIVPDHIILSQAPLFFQKDNFNGNFMQSIDQRNINSNSNTIYNNRNINNASSMANCGKIGPKILINGLYKDPDSDTGLSSMGDDGSHHIGTLV